MPSYAGFWRRASAHVIDTIITYATAYLFAFMVGMMFGVNNGDVSRNALIFIVKTIVVIACWIYYAGMESSSYQGTLGKLALGIRVTGMDGGRISFGRATGRYLAKIVSALLLLSGFFMAGWTKKKQALHDMIAMCLVVNRQ